MDGIQAIASRFKVAAAGNGSSADGQSTSDAFATLVQLAGARFTPAAAFGTLDANLITVQPAPQPVPDAHDPAPTNDNTGNASSPAPSKTGKSDSDQDGSASSDQSTSSANASSQGNGAPSDQATTNQGQVAVQALLATVQTPVAAQVQVTGTAVVAQPTAVTAPTDALVVNPLVQTAPTLAPTTPQAVVAPTLAAPVQTVTTPVTAPVQTAAPVATTPAATSVAQTAAVIIPQFQRSLSVATPTAAATTDASATAAPVTQQAVATAPSGSQVDPSVLRSAQAQDQSADLARVLGNSAPVQVQVNVATQPVVQTPMFATDPYNHYFGYNAGDASTSTANGQVGVNDPTTALVDTSKSALEQILAQQVPSTVMPAPLPAGQGPQQNSSFTTSGAGLRVEAAAPIAAPDAGAGSQGAQSQTGQTGQGFAFGSPSSGATSTSQTANASQANAPRPPVFAQQVIDQIKVNITRAAKAGIDQVSIQLKPEDLGRIDVKLEMSDDQKVRVTVTADNKDTLQLLQNDSRTLERALNDAGLRTDTANLQFNLRSESDPQAAGRGGSGAGTQSAASSVQDESDAAEAASLPGYDYSAVARSRGGVDTFA